MTGLVDEVVHTLGRGFGEDTFGSGSLGVDELGRRERTPSESLVEVVVIRRDSRVQGPQGGRICLTTTCLLRPHCLGESSYPSSADPLVPRPLGMRGSLQLASTWLGQVKGMFVYSSSFDSSVSGAWGLLVLTNVDQHMSLGK